MSLPVVMTDWLMALGAADDRLDARDQLVLVERLGHVIVGAEAERLDFRFDDGVAGEDENRRLHLGDAQCLQHFEAAHVGQLKIEHDDVVIVELAEVDALFAQIRRVDVEAFAAQHQFDAARHGAVVFDQEHAHVIQPLFGQATAQLCQLTDTGPYT